MTDKPVPRPPRLPSHSLVTGAQMDEVLERIDRLENADARELERLSYEVLCAWENLEAIMSRPVSTEGIIELKRLQAEYSDAMHDLQAWFNNREVLG